MATTTTSSRRSTSSSPPRGQRIAAGLAATIAVLYGLLFAGVLAMDGASAGELGILGVAGLVFAVLAGLLWWWRSRVLWAGAGGLQMLLAWMYLAIAPDRDPAFEVWGVTIRVISLLLLVTLFRLLLTERRARRGDAS